MAGAFNTTFVAELNRLAQGGTTYLAPFLEEDGAANKWAGTSSLPTIGALNKKAGTNGLGLNAVCNALAGTSGLEAVTALRTIAS